MPKWVHIAYSGLAGTTDYIFNLIKGDVNRSIEHNIIFYGVEEPSKTQLNQAKALANTATIIKQPGIDKNALKKLESELFHSNADIITVHVNSLIWHLPKLIGNKSKIIFVEHQANHLKTKKEFMWSYLAQRKAFKVVCLTDHYQSELKKKLRFGYLPKKNVVIQTGIEIDSYRQYLKDEKIRVGMVSRINELKDHATLLKAFVSIENPNIELHIAGDGSLLNSLKDEYKDSRISFHGYISPDEVRSLLAKLNIYVQATLGETSSIALMQAQATGLAIIASNVQGVREIFNETNGILVPVKNVNAMTDALVQLITNKTIREKLSKASRNYAEDQLDNKKMFNAYLSLTK